MKAPSKSDGKALRIAAWVSTPLCLLLAAAALGGAPVGLPSGIGSGLHSSESSAPAKPEPATDRAPKKKVHKHKPNHHTDSDQGASGAPSG